MRGDRRKQIEALFEEALDRPRGERTAWLEKACGADDALRRGVKRLLAAHERESGILEQPIDNLAAGILADPSATPVEGHRVADYLLVEEIGRGGMGVVFRARHLRLERFVALKFLPPHLSRNERAKARFIAEAKAASALDHPNICTIHDLGESDDGRLFMAMPYYEGETLAEILQRGPLSVDECVDLIAQIARGLDGAHEAGIVHRDIKPANIMVTERGEVKILDFGVAMLMDDKDRTRTGSAIGTISYMSPEQGRGERTDYRTDLWSLGVVMYEMLTGVRPFGGDTRDAALDAIQDEQPDAVHTVNSDVPADLSAIVDKLLRKDADKRYQNADELISSIEKFREKRRAHGETAGTPGAQFVVKRRSERWGIPVAAAAALIAIGAAFYEFLPLGNKTSAPHWQVKPLTGSVAYEASSSWSPDGGHIAFNAVVGNADVYTMPRGKATSVQLTDHPADELNPRWSPDGSKIAFVSDRGSGANVYWMPSSGGKERKLAETGLHYFERFPAVIGSMGDLPWSPDGRYLLFPKVIPTGETAIFRIHVETRETERLTNPPPGAVDLAASWSFDGESIVFQRDQGGVGSLWLTSADGGEPQRLLGDEFHNAQPTWSSDNRRIVFVSDRAGNDNLWDLEIATGTLRRLTSGPERLFFPSSSRTGLLAYSDFRHQTDLYLLDVVTGQEVRLTFHEKDNFDADFSPDGRRIVYHSTRSGDHEIWLLDPTTGREVNLSNHPSIDLKPDWSPDGERIIFLSNRDGAFHLWSMDARGDDVSRFTDQPIRLPSNFWSYSLNVKWAPDGKAVGFIAQTDEGRALWTVDAEGKNARPVVVGAHSFDWWRDSRHVIYNRVASRELRVVDLMTGEEAVLHQGALTEIFVARDGHCVAFSHAASHYAADLYQLQLRLPTSPDALPQSVGEPRQLTHGNGDWHVHNGAYSPDASRIVYTRDADEGDLYVITNYK